MQLPMIARALAIAAVVSAAAACGGTPAVTQRASQLAASQPAASQPAASQPAASQPAASAPVVTAAPQTTPAPVGVDACGLATIEEVSTALGTDIVTATAVPGSTSSSLSSVYCDYATADGTVALNVGLLGGSLIDTTYSSYANSGGAVPVPGIGDAAALTAYNTLYVKTGANVIGVTPLVEFDSPQELIAAVTPLAQAALTRL